MCQSLGGCQYVIGGYPCILVKAIEISWVHKIHPALISRVAMNSRL